jgi:hypothetical protein
MSVIAVYINRDQVSIRKASREVEEWLPWLAMQEQILKSEEQ